MAGRGSFALYGGRREMKACAVLVSVNVLTCMTVVNSPVSLLLSPILAEW